MKNVSSVMLGLSLTLGSAALSLAASQKAADKSSGAPAAMSSTTDTATPATKVKKHQRGKKHSKGTMKSTPAASAPATTSTAPAK